MAATTSASSTPAADKTALFTRQRDEMRTLLGQTGNQAGWDAAWQRGLTPWEAMLGNVAQPSLRWACEQSTELGANAATSDEVIPRTGKAFVPGCGRGQDVLYLAQRGFEAVGLDISATAVEAAQTWLAAQSYDSDDVRRRASVRQADYFDVQSERGTGRDAVLSNADLVYDYTFFCAIPAELHTKWAAAHAAALKPGGVLVCLVYPLKPDGSAILPDEAKQGPPYLVAPSMYTALLQDNFTLVFQGTPPDLPEHKRGRETIMVWRRKS